MNEKKHLKKRFCFDSTRGYFCTAKSEISNAHKNKNGNNGECMHFP